HAHGDLGRAGRADDDVRPGALEHDRRDHRAEARLARREAAGAARARIENAHAAVVHEAEPARDHARGHAERVGNGHAAALAIDHRDVGGVAGRRAACVEAGHVGLPARADLLGEAGGVLAAPEGPSPGTSTNLGSPTWRSLSIVARFMASATIRMYSEPLCSSLPRSKCSRMFSVSSRRMPPPGGWLLETRDPRDVPQGGAFRVARQPRRWASAMRPSWRRMSSTIASAISPW